MVQISSAADHQGVTDSTVGRGPAALGAILLWGEIGIVVAFLLFRFYVSKEVEMASAPPPPVIPVAQPDRTEESLPLKRGNFTVFRYLPGQADFAAHPRAIIIFGSGDGGPVAFEDRVCKALQADGYETILYNCNAYAKTDYDLETLQGDMNTIGQTFIARHDAPPPPLIIGGWSMGAEQAVPAGAHAHRPAGLAGLLLLSPGSRGRYGLRDADRWNVPPTGPGTFALADFGHELDGLRVVQWDANLDLLSSTAWLHSLTATHQAFHFPLGFHDYDGASNDFLAELKKSVAWILSPSAEVEP